MQKTDTKTKALTAGFKQQTEVGTITQEMADSIAKVEDVGTAMQRSAYQMMIAIESILREDHNFSDKDLSHLEEKLKRMLVTLSGLKDKGLSILNYSDMSIVGDLAEKWLVEGKAERKGISLPNEAETKLLGGK